MRMVIVSEVLKKVQLTRVSRAIAVKTEIAKVTKDILFEFFGLEVLLCPQAEQVDNFHGYRLLSALT
jgi:hypothetical protein